MIDPLQFFTVKVATGSGCLFQPLNSDYSYVLTAKHVIVGLNDIEITRQFINAEMEEVNEKVEMIEPPYIHTDPNKDAAIIKVKKVEGIELLLKADLKSVEKENWYLCGHPDSREDNKFSYRKNKLTIENSINHYIEGEVQKNVSQNEIAGQSGGGIIKDESSCFLLAGIQCRMAVNDGVESLSRIHFAPLSFFDEIILANTDNLSPLFPPYFASLEIILENIFPLTGIQLVPAKELLLKNQLKSIAKSLCASFTAQKVLELYQDTILSKGMSKSYITHKQLWIAFLELISINQIHTIDKTLTFDDLIEIRKKHNLVLIDCDDWVKKLDVIVKSDLSFLEKGGAIIVSSTKDLTPTTIELDAGYIHDICNVPTDEMSISSSVANLAEDLKIIHIYKFQKHIIENFKQFREINSGNVKETIIKETKNVI